MRIFVTVKPKAKKAEIEQIDPQHFRIAVTEPPTDNKANFAVIEALSKYLKIPYSKIRLIAGATARQKVFDLMI